MLGTEFLDEDDFNVGVVETEGCTDVDDLAVDELVTSFLDEDDFIIDDVGDVGCPDEDNLTPDIEEEDALMEVVDLPLDATDILTDEVGLTLDVEDVFLVEEVDL